MLSQFYSATLHFSVLLFSDTDFYVKYMLFLYYSPPDMRTSHDKTHYVIALEDPHMVFSTVFCTRAQSTKFLWNPTPFRWNAGLRNLKLIAVVNGNHMYCLQLSSAPSRISPLSSDKHKDISLKQSYLVTGSQRLLLV